VSPTPAAVTSSGGGPAPSLHGRAPRRGTGAAGGGSSPPSRLALPAAPAGCVDTALLCARAPLTSSRPALRVPCAPAACEKAVRVKCTGSRRWVCRHRGTYTAVDFVGAGAAAASCALLFTPLCFGLKSRSSKPVAAAVDKPSWPMKAATSLRSPATSPPPDMGVTKSPSASASASASVAATARRGLREVGTAEGPIPTVRWALGSL
jgi:hypothetical protein